MENTTRSQRRYGLTHDSIILHCPGPLRAPGGYYEHEWTAACDLALCDRELRANVAWPDGLTVVSYGNRAEKTLLECGLEYLGIRDFAMLRTDARPWVHRYKLEMMLEWLAGGECRSEYLLCLDADDNLIVNDPRYLLDRFHTAGCDVLFGATLNDAPPSPECWAFENSVAEYTDPGHAHLNSGGFIGRADFIRCCAQEILESWRADPGFCETPKRFSDQLGWRRMHRRYYPRIKIDFGCRIFLRFDHLR